jgi:hypothetical protein
VIAEDFFRINDIQINPAKSKLVVLNSRIKKEEQKILVENQELFSIKEKELVRFLGTWIGGKTSRKQAITKAKQISQLFANTIKKKLVSASQVLYINNVCLLPKLEYILQNIFLTKEECEKVQQPYTMVAKNKMGLTRTLPSYVLAHSGILNMRMLWNTLKTKQILSLMNRLNSKHEVKDVTEIRIRQGQKITSCSSIWTEKLEEEEIKLLKDNLACLIIQNNLNTGLEIIPNKENWVVKAEGTPIKYLLGKKIFAKAAKVLQELNIVVLEQILDVEGSLLMTWQQLKVSRKRSKEEEKLFGSKN